MDDLQREKVQSEQDFNKLLNEVSSDIEKMCAKHSEEKSSLRWAILRSRETFYFMAEW